MKKTQTKSTKAVKITKNAKEFYSFTSYVPNKNAKPVTYKGTEYLSKAQCMALEGITRKELDEYLRNQNNTITEESVKEKVVTVDQLEVEELLNV